MLKWLQYGLIIVQSGIAIFFWHAKKPLIALLFDLTGLIGACRLFA
jgi:hypothetical protein